MRWLDGLFVVLFVFAAAVQYNDPDPVVWITGYLTAAALSALAYRGRLPVLPNALAAIVFLGWFLTLAGTLPGAPSAAFTSFHMQAPSHEEPREAIGLLLCVVWTAGIAFRGWRQGRRAS